MKPKKTYASIFRRFGKTEGFSLLELIIVLVIVGLVIAIGLPGINKARDNAEQEMIRTRAVALQSAKLSYISALGTINAHNGWNTAGYADQDRYANLLIQYLPGTAPAALSGTAGSAYIPAPYTVNLGAGVGTLVAVTNAGQTLIPLQKY